MQNRISLFRAERGTSRRELAEAVGVNNQTIGYLERGDYKPSLELAMKIARYFDVSVEMLFSLERFEPIAQRRYRSAAVGVAQTRCEGAITRRRIVGRGRRARRHSSVLQAGKTCRGKNRGGHSAS